MSQFSPRHIGVIYDVNNMAIEGFETFRIGLELLGDYLQHCHAGGWRPEAKPRRGDATIDWEFQACDLSDSILDIPLFLSDLNAVGYGGYVSVEDFREMDHEAKLRRQIEYLKSVEG